MNSRPYFWIFVWRKQMESPHSDRNGDDISLEWKSYQTWSYVFVCHFLFSFWKNLVDSYVLCVFKFRKIHRPVFLENRALRYDYSQATYLYTWVRIWRWNLVILPQIGNQIQEIDFSRSLDHYECIHSEYEFSVAVFLCIFNGRNLEGVRECDHP